MPEKKLDFDHYFVFMFRAIRLIHLLFFMYIFEFFYILFNCCTFNYILVL